MSNMTAIPQQRLRRHALAAAITLALMSTVAHAQVSTATVKGQVTSGAASAQAGLVVTALNRATGNSYRSKTLDGGSYVLVGLAPGSYEVRITGANGALLTTQEITVQVGETAIARVVRKQLLLWCLFHFVSSFINQKLFARFLKLSRAFVRRLQRAVQIVVFQRIEYSM